MAWSNRAGRGIAAMAMAPMAIPAAGRDVGRGLGSTETGKDRDTGYSSMVVRLLANFTATRSFLAAFSFAAFAGASVVGAWTRWISCSSCLAAAVRSCSLLPAMRASNSLLSLAWRISATLRMAWDAHSAGGGRGRD